MSRLILHIFANAIAIYATSYFVPGFSFAGNFVSLVIAAVILAIIQIILKPVLKLLFGPLIILTLGLFLIVINALLLFILDLLSKDITIQGYLPLLYGTLIVSAINIAINAGRKGSDKK